MQTEWSEAIRELRNRFLLTQVELATRLGVSFATVNRWENDEHEPTMKMQRTLMKLFKDNDIAGQENGL